MLGTNVLWDVKGGAAELTTNSGGTVTNTGVLVRSAKTPAGVAPSGRHRVEVGVAPNGRSRSRTTTVNGHAHNHDTQAAVLAGIPAGRSFRTDSITPGCRYGTARINLPFGVSRSSQENKIELPISQQTLSPGIRKGLRGLGEA